MRIPLSHRRQRLIALIFFTIGITHGAEVDDSGLAAATGQTAEANTFLAQAHRARSRVLIENHTSIDVGDLIKKGDSLLGSLMPEKERDHALTSSLEAYSRSITTCYQRIEESTNRAVREAVMLKNQPLPDSFTLDPWGGPNQETGFFPSKLKVMHQGGERELPVTQPETLVHAIPPIYRLAEVLGIGRNALEWKADYIDPKLARLKFSARWGIVTEARIRVEIWGQFLEDKKNASPVKSQTFGRSVESLRRRAANANVSGRKLHEEDFAEYPILDRFRPGDNVWQAWKLENKLHTLGQVWRPASDEEPIRARVDQALADLQQTVRLTLKSDAELQAYLQALDLRQIAVRSMLTTRFLTADEFLLLSAQTIFKSLPDSSSIQARIDNGSLHAERVELVERNAQLGIAELRWRLTAALAEPSQKRLARSVSECLILLQRLP